MSTSSPTQLAGYSNTYRQTPQLLTSPTYVSNSWSQLAAGNSFMVGIKTNGLLYSWGVNASGQLGLTNDTISRSSPVQIGTSSWSKVAVGPSYTLALRSDNLMFSWGNNALGQLGLITDTLARSSPVQIGTGSSWSQITAGTSHAAAIRSDGSLWSWGDNTIGQLGQVGQYITGSLSPLQIGTSSWIIVSAGNNYTTAITTNYKLFAWGLNTTGQIGNSSVTTPYSWTSISNGPLVTVAIRQDGMLFTWGANNTGALGDNTTISKSSPVQIGTSSWLAVAASQGYNSADANLGWHILALRQDGRLFAWGSNNQGQLGLNDTFNRSSPVQISATVSYISIAASMAGSTSIVNDGTMYSWGAGSWGQIGNGLTISRSSPTQMGTAGDNSWTQVAASLYSRFAIKSGTPPSIWGWGYNQFGGLGNNTTIHRSSPVQIASTQSWSQIFSSNRHSMFAITNNNLLWSWGGDVVAAAYTLGDPTGSINRSSPIQVGGGGTARWSKIHSSEYFAAGLQTDGSLWMWGCPVNSLVSTGTSGQSTTLNTGFNYLGQFNDLTQFTYSWSQISSGSSAAAAIRSDGRLFLWGNGLTGQLGLGDTISRSSPTQLGTADSGPGGFWKKVSVGFHVAAIRCDDTLWTWGLNNAGQLGLNIVGTSAWQIFSGWSHIMAIRTDGILFGWGLNNTNQLGDFISNANRSSPVQIGGVYATSMWTTVAAGNEHTAAIRSDGTLFTWGSNPYGTLGDGTTVGPKASPTQIGNNSWTAVSAGYQYTAAIRSDGALFTWGLNGGYLGDGTVVARSSPVQIGSSSWTAVAACATHTVAIRSDGALFTWGNNYYGALGDGTTVNKSSPVQIGNSSWIAVDAGTDFTVAIRLDGALFIWGNNGGGVLGLNTPGNTIPDIFRTSPLQIGSSSWTAVAAGASHTVAIRLGGALFIWGYNNLGQLGLNDTVDRSSPVQIGSSSWKAVGAGIRHTVASRSDDLVFTWGDNVAGELGTNDTINRSSPVQASALPLSSFNNYRSSPAQVGTSSWSQVAVSAEGSHTIGITTTGRMWTWGLNSVGQLGTADFINRSAPVQIGSSSWTVVSAGFNHTLGIKLDSTLWGFGEATVGQLGQPTISATGFKTLSAGNDYTYGISYDNKLWAWGLNTYGQLGVGDTINRSRPVQIGNSSWTMVAADSANTTAQHCIGIKSDGTLWIWGNTDIKGGEICRSSPVQLGSNSNWSMVTTRGDSVLALTTTGTLYAWGQNAAGELGINDTIYRSSPTQIGTSKWKTVAIESTGLINGSAGHAGGIQLDGTLWIWGANTYGQLGQNDRINRSSPVQIGTDANWYEFAVDGVTGSTYAINGENRGLFGWGTNINGQLGTNDTIYRSSPVAIGGAGSAGTGYLNILCADRSLLVFKIVNGGSASNDAGRLYATGFNRSGLFGYDAGFPVESNRSSPVQVFSGQIPNPMYNNMSYGRNNLYIFSNDTPGYPYFTGEVGTGKTGLGDGITINRSSPVQLKLPISTISSPVQISTSNYSTVSAGNSHSMGITTTGSLYGWGLNTYGQAGNAPADIPISVAYHTDCSAYITANNELYLWGSNVYAQAGNGDATAIHRSSPVLLASGTRWKVISRGACTFAIRNDNTLWSWGWNTAGQLGQGFTSTNSRNSILNQIGTSSWLTVSSSSNYAAAIRADGTLWNWGQTVNGIKSSPVQIGTDNSWTSVYATSNISGNLHVIRNDGTLWALGTNIGDNTSLSRISLVQIGAGNSWSQVAIGASHGIAISTSGTLWVWGTNTNGQLGFSDTIFRSSPTQVGSNTNYIKIFAGFGHSVVISNDNTLWAWGANTYGQLGLNDTLARSSPTQVGIGTSWASLGIPTNGGSNNTAALTVNGLLYAWGYNQYGSLGQVGNNDTFNRSSPVQIPLGMNPLPALSSPTQVGTSSWIAIAAGASHTMAVTSDYAFWTWGKNDVGQFGLNNTITRSSPVQVGSSSWSSISTSTSNTYAITSTGLLWAWGRNSSGQLGLNVTIDRSSPVQVYAQTLTGIVPIPMKIGTSSWSQIQVERVGVYAIASNGLLYSWGRNGGFNFGGPNLGTVDNFISRSSPVQIGNNTISYQISPTQIGTSSWTTVSAGYKHALALAPDNSLYGWGSNGSGADATIKALRIYHNKINQTTPHWAVIATNGTLWTWGLNDFGQLGLGDTLIRTTPTQVPGSWSQVSVGASVMLGIKTDGTLWGCGAAGGISTFGAGVLFGISTFGGAVNTIARSSPSQIGTGNSWTQVVHMGVVPAGVTNAFILRNDGTLWGWGANANGDLGDNTTITRSSPVQIGVGNSFSLISAGDSHVIALRSTDNLAFNWGYNLAGQLGTNDTLNRSSPVQIGTGPYKKVAAGLWGTSLLTFDGLLYRIGIGGNGEIGDGLGIYRSNPVQVASTTVLWADIFDPGYACVTARKEDGTLWMWGRNPVSGGGLSSPVLTSSAAGDNAVFTQGIGSVSNGVVLMDSLGGLYAAGAGLNGYYKSPSETSWISALAPQPFKLSSNYSPSQIGTRSYIQVSAGTDSSTAIDYSKTLYFWGTNYNYQSGLPTASQFAVITSPVAIGTAASSTSDGTTNTGYIKNA